MANDIIEQVTNRWWTFLLRAIAAAALAVFAFASPGATTVVLVYVAGAYLLVSGATAIAAGIGLAGVGQWWTMLLLGLAEAIFGIIMLVEPGIGPIALAAMFAAWLITIGMMQLTAAFALRDVIDGEFWLGLLGVVTVAIGFYLIARPDIGVVALVYTIGWYAAFAAVTLTGLAFKLKSFGSQSGRRHAAA